MGVGYGTCTDLPKAVVPVEVTVVFPTTTEAVTTEAVTTEAVTTEEVTTKAETTEATTTEAATTEAATTEAATTEAATTEEATTEEATTAAATTEMATTEAATTEAATPPEPATVPPPCSSHTTCSSCLLASGVSPYTNAPTSCKWSAGSTCFEECAMDTSCYYLKGDESDPSGVAADKCLADQNAKDDAALCGESEAQSTCDACTSRIKSDGQSPCVWHGSWCGSELCPWYANGCGMTACAAQVQPDVVLPVLTVEPPTTQATTTTTTTTTTATTTQKPPPPPPPPPIVGGGGGGLSGPSFGLMMPADISRCVPNDVRDPVDPNYCFGLQECVNEDDCGGGGFRCIRCDSPLVPCPDGAFC